MKELLVERVKEIGCKLISLEIMPDHVHIFVEAHNLQQLQTE
ncbi:putative transposase, IS200 family [Candidatus Nitrososphaera gargensis Ga9.2]|uniref:Putative transposase, IS200 family n=1 Tax=Nitrososphaera gargensis (strain Ga9.2) TaxID=1237085 RepID=K0INN4_NITGG|nr:putative transposase, IS200 family [Candidatus Nitrososphaera gargensis Ga9.2]